MQEEQISKVWILEQFNAIHESIKNDLDKVYTKLDGYVSHPVCDERRENEYKEKERIYTRMNEIDSDMDKIKDTFDDHFNSITKWGWGVMGAIIVNLVIMLIQYVAPITQVAK